MNYKVVTDYFRRMPIGEVRHSTLREFKLHRLTTPTRSGKARSLATVNRELAMARRMFRVAVKEGWIATDPFHESDSLIALAHERERERILSPDEERRLLAACSDAARLHLRPLVIAALDTGCRQGELLKLAWKDVDLERGVLKITAFNSKTMRERLVGLTPRLAGELRRLRINAPDDDALVFGISDAAWFSAKRAWTSARRVAGLLDLRFHDLRHTAASRLAQRMALSDVGKILGHREPRSTWRYANTDQMTIARAVSVLTEYAASSGDGNG